MRASKLSRKTIVGIVAVVAIVLVVVVLRVLAWAGSGQVVVRMAGLEPSKEVASPAIAYVERHDCLPFERVTDYFEIAPEGDTVVNVSGGVRGERLKLVVVQPPVYADGSIYEKCDYFSGGFVVDPVQGFLFFKPVRTTFEVNLSGHEVSTPTVQQVSSFIEDEIRSNQDGLAITREQQSAAAAAALTDNEADAAYHEYEVWKYEHHSVSYESRIAKYADLLERVEKLDDGDVDELVVAYKEWCVLCYR